MQKRSLPARGALPGNYSLFLQDWKQGNALMRYFLASQIASMFLSMACSAGSIGVLATGNVQANLWLIAAAGISFITALSTWGVLKRRFRVRYAVW